MSDQERILSPESVSVRAVACGDNSLPRTPQGESAVVQALNLSKIYGEQRAVDGIDFSVKRGETFGLLGPNGAGKSTTMRMIACRTPLTSGELWVEGHNVRTAGRHVR